MKPAPTTAALLPSLTTLRDLLELLASLRNLNDPFSSPEALATTLDLALRFGQTLNLNPTWLNCLRALHNNHELLNVRAPVGHYLESLVAQLANPHHNDFAATATSDQGPVTNDSLPPTTDNGPLTTSALPQLLPLILQLLQLLQHLRKPN